jgi:hypothetical protein
VPAICGTQRGDTKLPASMLRSPASAKAPISFRLAASDTGFASFCNPSRGPTSTMRTCLGSTMTRSSTAAQPGQLRGG